VLLTAAVKGLVHYFDAVDVDAFADAVSRDAAEHALSNLLLRRPDLKTRSGKGLEVPQEERARFELDKLAFVAALADRLLAEVNGLVFEARRQGASWARVGVAINESPQTAFNRYRKLEQGQPRRTPQRKRKTGR
jgi:hypothetical protein